MSDQQPPPAPRSVHRRLCALAFVAYTALALVATFPLALHLSSQLPKDLGDPLIASSLLRWNAHVIPLTTHWWNGPGFFPMNGTMAFSTHFLGASLTAAPLQWLGLDAVTAYNLTFLASFPLCALAAHGLALTLTGRHDAGFVCGLAFGFNPFRVAHVEHLELLLAFGMPMALLALHRYVDDRRRRWLALFTAALIVQALSSSYYALFFTVFFGLWIAWFVRPQAWRQMLAIGAAGALAILVVSPIVIGYAGVHSTFNWRRDLVEEILRFSADVSSFATASPLSALWGWTAAMNEGERQLFPGLTIFAMAVTGMVWAIRSPNPARVRRWAASRMLWPAAAAFVAIAIAVRTIGPWQLDAGWLHVSATTAYKPLSVGVALAIMALLTTSRFRGAFHRRSTLAFYLIAAAALFLCSLGPQPTLFGERVLYQPPYAWLMRLPFFGDTIRAPARFAMLGILALSVAAALSFHRVGRPGARRLALVVVIIGIVLDGWMHALPLATVPRSAFTIRAHEAPVAVLELPLGDLWHDTAAVYRSTMHGVRVVNGYNGFEPIAYQVLRRGLADGDPTLLDALASFGPILIAVNRQDSAASPASAFVSSHSRVTRLRDEGEWTMYWLPRQPLPEASPRCAGPALTIAAAVSGEGAVDTRALTDQAAATRWIAPEDADDDAVVLDLGHPQYVCSLEISIGGAAVYYPGVLDVTTSIDGATWLADFNGRMAGAAWLAALADPRDARITIPLSRRPVRFVRLRADQSSPLDPWAIADVVVR